MCVCVCARAYVTWRDAFHTSTHDAFHTSTHSASLCLHPPRPLARRVSLKHTPSLLPTPHLRCVTWRARNEPDKAQDTERHVPAELPENHALGLDVPPFLYPKVKIFYKTFNHGAGSVGFRKSEARADDMCRAIRCLLHTLHIRDRWYVPGYTLPPTYVTHT